MPSTYSVFQYLPDPLTDERINFGVVAIGDGEVHTRFVRRWQRIGNFGTGDTAFLKEFARSLERDPDQLLLDGVGAPVLDEQLLTDAAGSWMNSIQVTTPRASTRPARELVDQMARRFLRETQPTQRRGRDRRAAVSLANERIETALLTAGGKRAAKLLRRDVSVKGRVEEHKFDLGAENGRVLLGVLGLSFESQSPNDSLRNLHAAAWAIDDTKSADPNLDLAVVMLPPKTRSNAYDHALYVFEALKADVVPEPSLDEWAPKVAETIMKKAAQPQRNSR